jgi:hypothetical protein
MPMFVLAPLKLHVIPERLLFPEESCIIKLGDKMRGSIMLPLVRQRQVMGYLEMQLRRPVQG